MSRRLAIDALEKMDRTSCLAQDAVRPGLGKRQLSPQDQAFLWELVQGVTRRRDTIDRILATFSRVKLKKVHPRVLAALRIAVYQLVWLDRIPDSAAVYQSVEIVKATFPEWVVKFVNGCLRAVTRTIDVKVAGPLPPEDVLRAVPIGGGRHCLFEKPLFPDPAKDPVGSLAARHGYRPWFVSRLLSAWDVETTEEILRAGNEPPSLWLRPSPGRLKELARELARRDIRHEVEASPEPGAIRLLESVGRLDELPGFAAGRFVVQDRSAMIPVRLLGPEPGETVLDLCAAPGGKTSQIAQAVGPEGRVVAVDRDERRLRRITETTGRLGLANVAVVAADGADADADFGAEAFDRVLVDVPCSNTGVLAKRAEARHRIDADLIDSLVEVQERLLAGGAVRVRPGGFVVYSTCALLPEENGEIVDAFLEEHPEFSLQEEVDTLPVEGFADGGYAARLVRAV